jgi:L-alanine-DL-glutamate epimerase-like enolase superfamily enzyme
MLDPAKLGIQAWLEAADAARAANMAVSSHLSPHLCSQLLCATDAAGWLEWTDWWEPFVGAIPVNDGVVIPSQAPVVWNEDALRQHRAAG